MNSKVNRFFPLFLILYEFCVNMSNDMYLPALPAISDDLSTSTNLVQLTIAAWFAGNTSVQLIVGPLSDRFGRRPILFGGGLLFLLSNLSFGFKILNKQKISKFLMKKDLLRGKTFVYNN